MPTPQQSLKLIVPLTVFTVTVFLAKQIRLPFLYYLVKLICVGSLILVSLENKWVGLALALVYIALIDCQHRREGLETATPTAPATAPEPTTPPTVPPTTEAPAAGTPAPTKDEKTIKEPTSTILNAESKGKLEAHFCTAGKLNKGMTFPNDKITMKGCSSPCDPKCSYYSTSSASELITLLEGVMKPKDSTKK